MSVVNSFKEAYNYLKSLVIGLGVTGNYFLKPGVTVIYPKQEVTNLDTYRGHVELVGKDEAPDVPKCLACGTCARVCPSQCLFVACPVEPKEGEPPVPEGEFAEHLGMLIPKAMAPAPVKGCKVPGMFYLDFSLCSLCGQCAKACPVDALRFSNHVYFASERREDFLIDLIARLKKLAPKTPRVAPPKPAGETAETAAEGGACAKESA